MSLIPSAVADDSIQNETDVLGGGGALNTAIYPATIALAYLGKSARGANFVCLHLKIDGREVRQTIYVTSGDDKQNRNYYEKDGTRYFLPGWNLMDSLSLLTVKVPFNDLDTEEKTVKLYDYDAKAEVPTKVEAITRLHGEEILVGLFRQTVDVRKNVAAEGAKADYQATGKTRDENEISKFFRAKDKLTTAEIRGGAEEAAFHDSWAEKWTGVTRDRTSGGTAPTQAGQAATGQASKPTSSLFS